MTVVMFFYGASVYPISPLLWSGLKYLSYHQQVKSFTFPLRYFYLQDRLGYSWWLLQHCEVLSEISGQLSDNSYLIAAGGCTQYQYSFPGSSGHIYKTLLTLG